MAYPTALARTKNWGNETLTDTDLEGQLDLIITWVNAAMNATTGHKHDASTSEGPKIDTGGLAADAVDKTILDLTDDYAITGSTTLSDLEAAFVSLPEGAAVATAAGEMALYTKDTSGQPELFAREESSGDEVQLTTGGQVNGGFSSRVFATIDGAQTINDGTLTKVDLDAEDIDNAGEFAGATMTIAQTGTYAISGQVSFSGLGTSDGVVVVIKAGAGPSQVLWARSQGSDAATGTASVNVSGIFALTAADTVELWANPTGGNDAVVVSGTQEGATYLSVHRIA